MILLKRDLKKWDDIVKIKSEKSEMTLLIKMSWFYRSKGAGINEIVGLIGLKIVTSIKWTKFAGLNKVQEKQMRLYTKFCDLITCHIIIITFLLRYKLWWVCGGKSLNSSKKL